MKTSTSSRPSPHFAIAKRGEGDTLPAFSSIMPLATRSRNKDSVQMYPAGL